MKLYRHGNHVVYERKSGRLAYVSMDNLDIQEANDGKVAITIKPETKLQETRVVSPSEIENPYGQFLYSNSHDIAEDLFNGYDVNIQDQTTPIVIVPFQQVYHSTTLAQPTLIDDLSINVTDSFVGSAGDSVVLFNPVLVRFSYAEIVSVVGNVVNIDRPLDVAYTTANTFVDIGDHNMAVDGSVTPQIFRIRGTSPSPVQLSYDVTRIIIVCKTASAVDLAKFGDLSALINGITIRRLDGTYENILNWKSNGELAGKCYDWTPYSATKPNEGQDGFVARLTFAGQNKMGVTSRLRPGEDLNAVVADNISGITDLRINTEGHLVDHY